MRLHHFTLSKAQLDAIPEDERTLLVLLAHASNELSVLTKIFHFASIEHSGTPLLIEARNAQFLTIGRLLTGKIHEYWELLRGAYFSTRISQKYAPLIDQETAASLEYLGRYFGRDNLIAKVRNNFAFHYSPQEVREGYATVQPDESFDVYLSKTNANTLYGFAEAIAGRALLNCINPQDHAKAMSDMITETSRVIGHVNSITGGLMSTCFKLHIGGDLYALGAKTIDIEGAADWKSIEIPYFVEISDDRAA